MRLQHDGRSIVLLVEGLISIQRLTDELEMILHQRGVTAQE